MIEPDNEADPRSGTGRDLVTLLVRQAGLVAPLAALVIACRPALLWLISPTGLHLSPYNIAVLAPNYFEDGFIRRGLAGTIKRLLDSGFGSGLAFHVLAAAWLTVPLALLLRRALGTRGIGLWLALVLILSPQMVWAWGADAARADMLTAGFIAWSAWFALSGRWTVAAAILAVGNLSHETAVIYGVPLLVALRITQGGGLVQKTRTLAAPMALLALLLAAAGLLQIWFGGDARTIAATIAQVAPASFPRDLATYIVVGGFRANAASLCVASNLPHFDVYWAAMLLTIGAYFFVLLDRRRYAGAWLCAGLLPAFALSFAAIDYGRWTSFSILNLWLTSAVLAARDTANGGGAPSRRALAIFAMLVVAGPASVLAPNYLVEREAKRLWGSPLTQIPGLYDRCDPAWRTAAGLPVQPPAPRRKQ